MKWHKQLVEAERSRKQEMRSWHRWHGERKRNRSWWEAQNYMIRLKFTPLTINF